MKVLKLKAVSTFNFHPSIVSNVFISVLGYNPVEMNQ